MSSTVKKHFCKSPSNSSHTISEESVDGSSVPLEDCPLAKKYPIGTLVKKVGCLGQVFDSTRISGFGNGILCRILLTLEFFLFLTVHEWPWLVPRNRSRHLQQP